METQDKLINFADLRRNNQNIKKHYASASSLKLKANAAEVYTRQQIDAKLAAMSTGGEVDLSAYAKTEDVEKAIQEVQTIKGDKGDQGETGSQGPKGEDGANGKDGVDGQDGKSAYDIAKENGFTGTEAEWVESLKGEKGDPGEIPNVENFVQKEDLNGYAKTEDIPDVSNLATKDDIPDVSNLATKDDIPDTSQFAKTSDIPKAPTLAELGGVSQAGVESILQSKNFLSEDAIKELINSAIAEAMKNSGGDSGGSTDPQPEDPTPTTPDDPTPSEPVSDDDYAWTHYFVMPQSKNQITDNVRTFFHPGEEQLYSDFVGENYDMVNTTIEIRLLGSLRDNENTACAMDDDIKGRTFATDVTKVWKDGIRVPFDFCDGEGTVDCAAYKAEISKFFMANNSELTYDCDEETGEMHFKTFTAACGFLYMVRKLKPGKVFPTYSMGEKIA